jgi:hypothetical protein
MPEIPTIFEQELRNQAPARLDGALLDRLTSCAEGSLTELSDGGADDAEFAALLGAVKPRAIPAALQSSLFAALEGIPFAVDEKIVLFHGQAKAGRAEPRSFRSFNIAAAAAVAIFGAAAAFMLPYGDNTATADRGIPPANSTVASAHFAPAGYGRNLHETRDEGVIWRGKNQPQRVLRLTYMEKVTMENEDGESIQVERPHYEYVIIPEKID